ncbi:MAG: hypothetical protein QXE18_04055 [Thermoplasmata archaeon]
MRSIQKRLDRKNDARESAIAKSRQIVRECRSALSAMQSGKSYIEHLKKARRLSRELSKVLADFPDILHAGYVLDAQQELAEAEIIAAHIEERSFPSPKSIGVSDEAFVLGLGDSIGELRRLLLSRLMEDDMRGARKELETMERLFRILMMFDYPDTLLASKRKQDVARSLLEKSRSELVMSSHMHKLKRGLKK